MIVPTWLIIPPAFVALNIFMYLYWLFDPSNRLTDKRFVLGTAATVVILGQMFVLIQRCFEMYSSIALSAAAFILLIVAFQMLFGKKPEKQPRPGS